MKNWFYLSHPIGFIGCAFTIFLLYYPIFFSCCCCFTLQRINNLFVLPMRFFYWFFKYSGLPTVRKIFTKYFIKKKKNTVHKYLPIIHELPFWTLLAISSIAFPIVPITFEIIEANILSLPKIFSNGDVATCSPFFFLN